MLMKIFPLLLVAFLLAGNFSEADESKKSKKADLKEETIESFHHITINGEPLYYKAAAGNFFLKDDQGEPKGSIFFTSYTKENGNSNRPIGFCFYGGPGSSSIWLHIGGIGPKIITLSESGTPSLKLRENELTFLDMMDLVFIDPISTGYSREVQGEAKQFHGVEEDIKSVAEFIRLYITRNQRWESPKYLIGESYGTTRAAGLADHLHDTYYINLDGLILISSVLNMQTLDCAPGNDLAYALFLPSYTAAAWYHQKLSPDLQNNFEQALRKVESFALNEYTTALMKGDSLKPEEKIKILEKLSYFTGLSPRYLEESHLRVEPLRFAKELLRDDRKIIGRFDIRPIGIDQDCASSSYPFDPSFEQITGPLTALMHHYLQTDLNCKKDEFYEVIANVHPWNCGKATNKYVNMAVPLKEVMAKNPSLKIFVASGYFDLATPYFATDYTFNHLHLEPELKKLLDLKYYQGGHMIYFDYPAFVSLKNDIGNFINR